MRTTIDIPDEQRAKLLEIAAARGEKGFSAIVREALELYLRQQGERAERIDAALAERGSLQEDEAAALYAHVQATRQRWR